MHYNVLTLNGQQFEEVKDFIYIGSMVNTESDIMQEVNRRINIARASVQKMDKIWKSKAVTYKPKLCLARSTVFAIASCGSESWTVTRTVQKKLNAFNMWSYQCTRVSWREKRTNEWVLQKLRAKMMLFKQITSRKRRFFGHAMRHDGQEETITQGKVEGMQGRGRRRRVWHSDIEEWIGCKLHPASQLAVNHDRWHTCMKDTATHLRAN